MNDIAFTSDEQSEVNRLIDLFIAGEIADPLPQRSATERPAVERTGVLPALEDWSAYGGISRGAEIVWVDRDSPFSTEPIEDARIQRIVLVAAARRYPSLSSLRPARPHNARDCNHCGGTGRVSFGTEQETIQIGSRERSIRDIEDRFVCFCGGLGWLLDDE